MPVAESVPLARVTRSGVEDTLHRGSAVVVDDTGKVVLALGNPDARAYFRSAAKPIQCIPVITCGAADAFRLDDNDIAILCGSHRGKDEQIAQVRAILAKIGLPEDRLQSGTGIADNCSGKHAGMLAACRDRNLPVENYTDPDHPHQLAVLQAINLVCNLAPREAHVGVDGCSAPIHYFSISKMALGFARMSVPERHFDPPVARAIRRIIPAMWNAPDGHTGEPLYREVLGGGVRLLTKLGGGGVYCAGLVGRGLGFAMKVEDGSSLPLLPIFTRVMRQIDFLSTAEAQLIAERFWKKVDNRRGRIVGAIEPLI